MSDDVTLTDPRTWPLWFAPDWMPGESVEQHRYCEADGLCSSLVESLGERTGFTFRAPNRLAAIEMSNALRDHRHTSFHVEEEARYQKLFHTELVAWAQRQKEATP